MGTYREKPLQQALSSNRPFSILIHSSPSNPCLIFLGNTSNAVLRDLPFHLTISAAVTFSELPELRYNRIDVAACPRAPKAILATLARNNCAMLPIDFRKSTCRPVVVE